MLVKTKHFGEIELAEDKVLTFENGILGFENQKHYTILYNNENETRSSISWLQSLEEPTLALPIIFNFKNSHFNIISKHNRFIHFS